MVASTDIFKMIDRKVTSLQSEAVCDAISCSSKLATPPMTAHGDANGHEITDHVANRPSSAFWDGSIAPHGLKFRRKPKTGATPISIAINEMSNRKTPALVSFLAGNRLIGEEAARVVARYPIKSSLMSEMIGKHFDYVKNYLNLMYLPFEMVEDSRGSVAFKIDDSVATILSFGMNLAEIHVRVGVKDAVISVPPYFGQAERRGLIAAAQLLGINVLSLINEHSGAAFQYGIDKDFSNGSRHVIFHDMMQVVKDVRWNPQLGGQDLKLQLVEHFADEFNKQMGKGVDVRKSPKAMAKLRKRVMHTKEILSANTAAPISVESLYDDWDFWTYRAGLSLIGRMVDGGQKLRKGIRLNIMGGVTTSLGLGKVAVGKEFKGIYIAALYAFLLDGQTFFVGLVVISLSNLIVKLLNDADKVKNWLEGKEVEQKKTSSFSTPAFTSEEGLLKSTEFPNQSQKLRNLQRMNLKHKSSEDKESTEVPTAKPILPIPKHMGGNGIPWVPQFLILKDLRLQVQCPMELALSFQVVIRKA
ncbi:Heat shock protein 70 family [Dillenia turbinata]|uniref:Heat shock protein 70 family n=1 Tax=Dillenia turbinata TaxID=194707 RepID=A0AAN8UR08_9MAGN